MPIFKPKAKAPVSGVVLSVRPGARTRVCIQPEHGDPVYVMCSSTKKKPGDTVKQGRAIGIR